MKTSLLIRHFPRVLFAALAVTMPTGCAVVGLVAAAHPLLTVGAGAVVGIGSALLSDRDQSRTSDSLPAADDGLAPLPNLAALKAALNLTIAQVVQIAPLLAEIDKSRQMAAAALAKTVRLNASLPMDVGGKLTGPQQLQLAQMLRGGRRGGGFPRQP